MVFNARCDRDRVCVRRRERTQELHWSIFHWRFDFRWYLISTVGIAALALAARFIQAAATPSAPPAVLNYSIWPGAVWYGLSMFVIDRGLLGEDTGWQRIALPRMLNEFNLTLAAVLLGLIWALWHVPAFLFSGMPQSSLPLHWFIIAMVSITVLMNWASINTGGAVIPAILMHWSFNRFSDLSHAGAIYAALTYMAAAIIVVAATCGTLGRRSTPPRGMPRRWSLAPGSAPFLLSGAKEFTRGQGRRDYFLVPNRCQTQLPQSLNSLIILVTPGRFERPAYGLGNRCSIRLSYGVAIRTGFCTGFAPAGKRLLRSRGQTPHQCCARRSIHSQRVRLKSFTLGSQPFT